MNNINFFEEKSKQLRLEIFEKFCETRQGHPGSIYSMLDLVVGLYYGDFLHFNSESNQFNEKIIISKGHAASALYPVLKEKNIIDKKDWDNWGRSKNSLLKIFGNINIPGIDATSGSLGHGIGIGAGYAYSFQQRKLDTKVFVIISEGELYEGSIWESLLFVNHYNLNNLHIIIDRNNLMILGDTEKCLRLEPIEKKIESFGFKTKTIDGHNFNEILTAYDEFFIPNNEQCNCIIANTIKGKGISKFENQAKWHYWNHLDKESEEEILRELNGISER